MQLKKMKNSYKNKGKSIGNKKKTIKIGFRYFWGGFDPEDNFFTNLLRKKYNVVISEKPDYMFFSVYPEGKPVENIAGIGKLIKTLSPQLYVLSRKWIGRAYAFFHKPKIIEGDFIKIFYGAEHVTPKMEECEWAFGSHFEDEIGDARYMRIPPNHICDYQLPNFGRPPVKKVIDFRKIKKEKTKFCNFIYSQEVSARNEFFKKLNAYKKVDAPGRCMNNMPAIGSDDPRKSRLSEIWTKQKLKFIKPYKFTIAFENFSSPGWVTEKLNHPMLVNSLPIYFGNKDVARDFNTKSFININDFKNVDELIAEVIRVDKDDRLYEHYLKQPWYPNNRPSPDTDLGNKRLFKRFEEIFG